MSTLTAKGIYLAQTYANSDIYHPVHFSSETSMVTHMLQEAFAAVFIPKVAHKASLTRVTLLRWNRVGHFYQQWGKLIHWCRIKVHFKDSKGDLIKTVEANEGDDLLSIAHEYDIDLEEHYDLLPEPDDEENDMLDMAFGLTDTSRLGCQVVLTRDIDGLTATLPAATRNMFVDGG
ncbi:hypothetical protein H0H87_006899 [Tephrocybe sp. NHM501043]|nr:hypothetical protein H0H87_006899 [Tephrocybe sp. NHM501043]